MIPAFMIGVATGVAIAATSLIVVAAVTCCGRSSARHWQHVQRLIYQGVSDE